MDFAAEIEKLKAAQDYRTLRPASGLDFSSNDYLGLSRHPALIEAAANALHSEGALGAGGSRLLRGHHPLHGALEEKAAAFFDTEAALYFGSGFLANFALFTTLAERHDAVVFDERVHASIKEGLHASPAQRYRARHNEVEAFEAMMAGARAKGARRLFVAVESLYSMDGDVAPLAALGALARRFEATLIVDEAHATGVFGARGRGLGEGLDFKNTIWVHTGGKALGVAGALVCADEATIEYLINKARPFIYSTAPPPLLAAALMRALDLIDEEPWRREKLRHLAGFAGVALREQAGDAVQFGGSQIIPVILGSKTRALEAASALQAAGFDVRAIRPPTVAANTSRLRISINEGHSKDGIRRLAKALGQAGGFS